jgi:hypothetical protein
MGSPIGGMKIHGPSAITMMLIIPSTLLAVVLLNHGCAWSTKGVATIQEKMGHLESWSAIPVSSASLRGVYFQ